MDVKITFRTPSRRHEQGGASIHERTLEAVPRTEAEQMAEDFVQFRNATNGTKESELYRYDKDGQEVLVALNFKEVVALTASGDE
jgi:hypothetical protein